MLLRLLVAGAAFILPSVQPAIESAPERESGVLFGQVSDGGTGDMLSGIQVSLPDQEIGTVTGRDGLFRLEEVPPEEVMVLLEHPCFHSVAVKVDLSERYPQRRLNVGMPCDGLRRENPGMRGR